MLTGIALGLAMGPRRTVKPALGYLLRIVLIIPALLAVFLCVSWFGYSGTW